MIERLATKDDLDGVLAIEDASFNNPTTREWYERELNRPDVCFIYVLRIPDHPVAAFCAFWLVADQAHVNNLAVRPELRGRGLGKVDRFRHSIVDMLLKSRLHAHVRVDRDVVGRGE